MPDVFSEDLAGNYENVMLLSNKGYTSPALVRKSLTDGFPLNHTVETGKLPGFCSKVRLTFHTSFIPRRPLDLAIEGCEQLLHLPLMMLTPMDYLSCPLDFSICFQATTIHLCASPWWAALASRSPRRSAMVTSSLKNRRCTQPAVPAPTPRRAVSGR